MFKSGDRGVLSCACWTRCRAKAVAHGRRAVEEVKVIQRSMVLWLGKEMLRLGETKGNVRRGEQRPDVLRLRKTPSKSFPFLNLVLFRRAILQCNGSYPSVLFEEIEHEHEH